MGKTTKYHPVSLHVIRGAAEWCGWKFKTIKQKRSNRQLGEATYIAQIEIMPDNMQRAGDGRIHNSLQQCFMRDIQVKNVWKTKSGVWFAELDIRLGPGPGEQK